MTTAEPPSSSSAENPPHPTNPCTRAQKHRRQVKRHHRREQHRHLRESALLRDQQLFFWQDDVGHQQALAAPPEAKQSLKAEGVTNRGRRRTASLSAPPSAHQWCWPSLPSPCRSSASAAQFPSSFPQTTPTPLSPGVLASPHSCGHHTVPGRGRDSSVHAAGATPSTSPKGSHVPAQLATTAPSDCAGRELVVRPLQDCPFLSAATQRSVPLLEWKHQHPPQESTDRPIHSPPLSFPGSPTLSVNAGHSTPQAALFPKRCIDRIAVLSRATSTAVNSAAAPSLRITSQSAHRPPPASTSTSGAGGSSTGWSSSNIYVRPVPQEQATTLLPMAAPLPVGVNLNVPPPNYLTIGDEYRVYQYAPGFERHPVALLSLAQEALRDTSNSSKGEGEEAQADRNVNRSAAQRVAIVCAGTVLKRLFQLSHSSSPSATASPVLYIQSMESTDTNTRLLVLSESPGLSSTTTPEALHHKGLTAKLLYHLLYAFEAEEERRAAHSKAAESSQASAEKAGSNAAAHRLLAAPPGESPTMSSTGSRTLVRSSERSSIVERTPLLVSATPSAAPRLGTRAATVELGNSALAHQYPRTLAFDIGAGSDKITVYTGVDSPVVLDQATGQETLLRVVSHRAPPPLALTGVLHALSTKASTEVSAPPTSHQTAEAVKEPHSNEERGLLRSYRNDPVSAGGSSVPPPSPTLGHVSRLMAGGGEEELLSLWFEAFIARVPLIGQYVHQGGVVQEFQRWNVHELHAALNAETLNKAIQFTVGVLESLKRHCQFDKAYVLMWREGTLDLMELTQHTGASPTTPRPAPPSTGSPTSSISSNAAGLQHRPYAFSGLHTPLTTTARDLPTLPSPRPCLEWRPETHPQAPPLPHSSSPTHSAQLSATVAAARASMDQMLKEVFRELDEAFPTPSAACAALVSALMCRLEEAESAYVHCARSGAVVMAPVKAVISEIYADVVAVLLADLVLPVHRSAVMSKRTRKASELPLPGLCLAWMRWLQDNRSARATVQTGRRRRRTTTCARDPDGLEACRSTTRCWLNTLLQQIAVAAAKKEEEIVIVESLLCSATLLYRSAANLLTQIEGDDSCRRSLLCRKEAHVHFLVGDWIVRCRPLAQLPIAIEHLQQAAAVRVSTPRDEGGSEKDEAGVTLVPQWCLYASLSHALLAQLFHSQSRGEAESWVKRVWRALHQLSVTLAKRHAEKEGLYQCDMEMVTQALLSTVARHSRGSHHVEKETETSLFIDYGLHFVCACLDSKTPLPAFPPHYGPAATKTLLPTEALLVAVLGVVATTVSCSTEKESVVCRFTSASDTPKEAWRGVFSFPSTQRSQPGEALLPKVRELECLLVRLGVIRSVSSAPT